VGWGTGGGGGQVGEEIGMITTNIWMKSLFKCCEIFQKQLMAYQI
jgi:hypothetical protein